MSQLQRTPELTLPDGKVLLQGDLFKVIGEYGMQFKFHSHTVNLETGAEWVDCFEMFRGHSGAQRSFTSDRIKRIPKKRKKKSVI
jgi:hypothetical protein